MTRRLAVLAAIGTICVLYLGFAIADEGGLPQCEAELAESLADLETCQGAAGFPGDGISGRTLSFTDNGDGTVTDNNTGLTWEKKVNSPSSDPHYITLRTYAETEDWIDSLNSTCNGDGAVSCSQDAECSGVGAGMCGFNGRQDWRLPNRKEMVSVLDFSANPAVSTSGIYPFPLSSSLNVWTTTPGVGNPGVRYVVDLRLGGTVVHPTTLTNRAVAVR